MFSLWNPTAQPEDIAVSFRYGDGSGSYNLPVHLDAQGSAMLDVGMLKMQHTLDSSGQPFSASVTQGSVSFQNAQPGQWMQLVASGGTFNTATATCGQTCIQCCGWNYNSFYLGASPGSTFGVGDSSQYTLYGTDCSKPSQQVPVDSWSSYNTSIASVNGSGNVTGVAPGSTTIEADTSVYGGPNYQACAEWNPTCATGNHSDTGPATVVSVQVTNVSLTSDEVQVTLQGPGGQSGTLQVTWQGPSGASNIANQTEGPGGYTFYPPLDSSDLPTGEYSGVKATWMGASGTYSISFDVLGVWRHSQYNTPNESACAGGSSSAYLVNSTTCGYQTGSLVTNFINQSWLNGSGITINAYYGFNTEQDAQYCGNHNKLPGDWSGKSFAFVPQFTPSCSGGSLGNNTVAYNPSDGNISCGDQVLIVGLGSGPGTVKTVTDYCPVCSSTQLDNYTTSAACQPNSFPDLGNLQTIRLNH